MLKNQTINLKVIEKVALALEEINNDVIYVGGAVVSLYVNDTGAEQPRPTKDIDISVQISSYAEMDELRQKLSTKKIYPSVESTVMYRYTHEDILIDFIPFEPTPLGPTNRWLKPGFKKAYPIEIGRAEIRILPVCWFLATKWEAFKSRGSDPRMSPDFEDIIYIIDNNLDIVEVVKNTDKEVRIFLQAMCREIINHTSVKEIIECHINPYTANERSEIVINRLNKITEIEENKINQ